MDDATLKFFLERYPCKEVPPAKPGEPVTQFVTCPARLAFAFLDTPKQVNGKEMYACSLIIPPAADLSIPQRIYSNVAAQRFGPNWQSMQLKSAVKPQSKCFGKYEGFSADGFYFDCSSKFPVAVFDRNKNQMSTKAGMGVYSGMWVLAWLRVYAYPLPGPNNGTHIPPGIGFGIVSLQKIADDEEFKGADRSDAFDVVAHEPAGAPATPARPPQQLAGWGA